VSIGLLGLGAFVPERVMTNADWAAFVDTSDEWIMERTGIRRRHLAADDESTAVLAVRAARSALEDARMSPTDVDEIIVATDTPEVYSPDTASFVQHGLGAREIPAYDLGGSGCAGFVLALDIARTRAAASGARILVVGVEVITRLMDWHDRNTCVLFGDAAGAAVVGPLAMSEASEGANAAQGCSGILASVAGTDGSHSEILGMEVGGTRKPFTEARAAAGLHQRLVMDGRQVYREAVRRMTDAARRVLVQAQMRVDDVDLFVPHQANLRIIESVGRALGIAPAKVFTNIEEFGNTGSASVPVALWQAKRQGRMHRGDLVLLAAFGAGFHWAAMLLRY
jgi:3-oxoacyl-[acyl-carrier-protein] synthase III